MDTAVHYQNGSYQNGYKTEKKLANKIQNGDCILENGTEYKMQYGVEGPKGALVLDGHSPKDVALAMIEKGGQSEPFYLFDMDEVHRRIKYFKKMMPRIKIFYAMKANDWDLMLKLVVSLGAGFDCASPCEINKIIKLGVNPESIIFAIPTKTKDWMTFARESGVKHTTFDSSYELKKLKLYWPDVKLLIRIRVDGESTYKLGEKFGCDFDTEAIDLLEEAASLGLSVVGVAFHVGSVCTSFDSHEVGLRRARKLFDHEAKAGRKMKIVDIGGGFLSDRIDRIDEVSKRVNNVLEELFPDPEVQVIAEPGRYFCDTAATLFNSINNIRKSGKDKNMRMIYINDGLHGTLRYIEPWQTIEVFSPKQNQNGHGHNGEKTEEVILWGPTCDSTDRVREHSVVMLPPCSPTDWLIFNSQGAYTWGFAGPFSSIPIPYGRAVISKELWNEIKECPVFREMDFVINDKIEKRLPSSLPLRKPVKFNKQINTPVLI